MLSMSNAMQMYFSKMFKSLKVDDKEYPMTCNTKGLKNILLVSEPDNSGWCKWQPIIKTELTDFTSLETKYSQSIHQSIKDYYNKYWFYEISGTIYIDSHMGQETIELESVIPGKEGDDLDAHIARYFRGGDISNFQMIPIGLVQNLFVVVDNITGEIFVDDRLEFGICRKVANNLAELINKLEP